ncbi:sigma-70 family RNA polymerase sigma factor [Geothrix sp.]|jgi:RNA polymerase sigma-70 factor (ECF subfamily)|uniref:RNA polymerase sigma factor n=1 Tax=Geothrix sp. TaxID=1962974 RepID=UPI0025BED7BF|nr:sigma-70 family RNA polymerase sigma factor [Geothrix sp.]
MNGVNLTCESLVEGHLDAIYAYARAKVRQEDLARDIVQRTFLKAFEKRGQLRDVLAVRGWLLSILRNEIAMEFRASAKFEVWDDQAFENIPSPEGEEPVDPVLLATLPEAMADLSEAARSLLYLRYQQDLSYEEMADILGIPMGTVQSRLHRAKASLKSAMAKAGNRLKGGAT